MTQKSADAMENEKPMLENIGINAAEVTSAPKG